MSELWTGAQEAGECGQGGAGADGGGGAVGAEWRGEFACADWRRYRSGGWGVGGKAGSWEATATDGSMRARERVPILPDGDVPSGARRLKRMPRITGGAIDVAIESSQKVPFNPPPKDSSVPRPAGAMRPHNLGGELAVESAKEAGQPLDNATPTDVSGGRAIDKTALK